MHIWKEDNWGLVFLTSMCQITTLCLFLLHFNYRASLSFSRCHLTRKKPEAMV